MAKTTYCMFCATPITKRLRLRTTETTCAGCGADLKMRKSLFGKNFFEGRLPDENVIVKITCRPRRRGGEPANG